MRQILLHFIAQETEGPPGKVHNQSHKPQTWRIKNLNSVSPPPHIGM